MGRRESIDGGGGTDGCGVGTNTEEAEVMDDGGGDRGKSERGKGIAGAKERGEGVGLRVHELIFWLGFD